MFIYSYIAFTLFMIVQNAYSEECRSTVEMKIKAGKLLLDTHRLCSCIGAVAETPVVSTTVEAAKCNLNANEEGDGTMSISIEDICNCKRKPIPKSLSPLPDIIAAGSAKNASNSTTTKPLSKSDVTDKTTPMSWETTTPTSFIISNTTEISSTTTLLLSGKEIISNDTTIANVSEVANTTKMLPIVPTTVPSIITTPVVLDEATKHDVSNITATSKTPSDSDTVTPITTPREVEEKYTTITTMVTEETVTNDTTEKTFKKKDTSKDEKAHGSDHLSSEEDKKGTDSSNAINILYFFCGLIVGVALIVVGKCVFDRYKAATYEVNQQNVEMNHQT